MKGFPSAAKLKVSSAYHLASFHFNHHHSSLSRSLISKEVSDELRKE